MKKQRIFAFCLAVSLFFSFFLLPSAGAYEPFDLSAKAGLLIEANTGEILYQKNAHAEEYPASLTKIMTALLVLEAVDQGKLSLTQELTASHTALHTDLVPDGSTANVKEGETMSVEEYLYCMLVVSANEVCNIFAEAVDGTIDAFVDHMNRRAVELGCENTHFANTTGLHDPNHYTTAWDIYLITCEALKHDLFLTVCNTKNHTVPATNLSKARTLYSTNYLISNWRRTGYVNKEVEGIKTGSTSEAGYCLVSSAVRGSRRLISVVLGAETVKLPDGSSQVQSFSETTRLFNWGFDTFASKEILSTDEMICEVPVTLSSETNYVIAHPAAAMERMIPKDWSADDLTRTVTLNADSFEAPIAAGDVLGTLTISHGDTVYGETELIALSDVSASRLLVFRRDLLHFFEKTWVRVVALVLLLVVVLLIVSVVLIASSNRRRRKKRSGSLYSSNYRGGRR